ncbi:diguanylate cyclase (GGDEF)-like protein [Geodermatophilus bullaregiensis]|uniref:sensor domain-containing diguanylate cyclase n=1 Tax=Geodermatophilus bullaregiensis TaxID=1564160 RepID=UPI00195A8245|nr:sensor domain-containing diguanylate cyclase [Geodermatophilus bullaregiensis]MBM7806889.1 diguanylate cyclase (GGDEF)-like protein [Geodermatophilus bullaregiensis]
MTVPTLPDEATGPCARRTRLPAGLDVQDLDHDAELAAVVRIAAAVTGMPFATVNVLDDCSQHQIAPHGFPGATTAREESLCSVVNADAPAVRAHDDLSTDPVHAASPWVDGRYARVRAYASAPLVVDGALVGTLCVFDTAPHALAPATGERLADLAAVVVALLQRRRQAAQLADLAVASSAAREQAEAAAADRARSEAFTRALLEALPVGVVAADAEGRITLCNRVGRRWHGLADGDVPGPAGAADPYGDVATAFDLCTPDGRPLEPHEVPLARVFTEGRVHDAEIAIARPGERLRVLRSSGALVVDGQGRPAGAVLASMDVTDQRELEARLREAALHDALTGLPNRALLLDRVELALRAQERDGLAAVLLYCDLDGFKGINDTLGHAAGDAALLRMATVLRGTVRPGDTVARIGGDEFVVLCPGAGTELVARALVARIERTLAAPADGGPALRSSTGVALSRRGDTPDSLLRRGDAAMYEVKRSRR